jgi:galactokinase
LRTLPMQQQDRREPEPQATGRTPAQAQYRVVRRRCVRPVDEANAPRANAARLTGNSLAVGAQESLHSAVPNGAGLSSVDRVCLRNPSIDG